MGPVKLAVTPDEIGAAEFQQLQFPKEKQQTEAMVASGFVACIETLPGPDGQLLKMSNLVQNDENDLDFSVTVNGVASYLELVEAAPLNGPYEKAPSQYTVGAFAQQVLASIGDKAARYSGSRPGKPLYLLVYVTHWAFIFSDSVIQCLRYWLGMLPSPFTAIFLYKPVTPSDGASCWLYPAEPRAGSHPDQVINSLVTNSDPRSMRDLWNNEGGSTLFSFPPVRRGK